ncbi:putative BIFUNCTIONAL PENICILLIN-BINDING PROTEIN 1A/1B PONA1 domain protein [Mycobacterium ulcerans str. Harvey]|uniref:BIFUNCTIONAL PENICILLIN-BINDING PROTEIN 1A/1B PONA1 domain protein n=1 Tax=Mycobacterium ulcerans str. Harvey TaxID=1299332 RepID=A0ABN0R8A4_MYCUL|nr:putative BIFUNCTIONAL PENICILLIN-BINDING PROTEIN 1A/1B PONA1 domain protein [Mycobacterium ulcerans str. Harvey]
MSNEGRHHQPPSDARGGPAGDDMGGQSGNDERSRSAPVPRRAVPPDDRMTTIIPAVSDPRSARHADPIEEVKAALDSPPSTPLQRDRLDQVKAALDAPPTRPIRSRRSGGGLPPDGGAPPPAGPAGPSGPTGRSRARSHRSTTQRDWLRRINWKWVRRSAYLAAAVVILLPIVTFTVAYFIVDVPRPGDIRTNQVSTILASDGSEIAKIVPPKAIGSTSTSVRCPSMSAPRSSPPKTAASTPTRGSPSAASRER